jgi:hypothetical protein
MVASAIFLTDLSGKPLITRNYRGDIPLTSAIEKFTQYLLEVEEENKKPVFYVGAEGEFVDCLGGEGGSAGGETFVYVQVSLCGVFDCCTLNGCIWYWSRDVRWRSKAGLD